MFSRNNFFNTLEQKRIHLPTTIIQCAVTKQLLREMLGDTWPVVVVHDQFIKTENYFDDVITIRVSSEPTEKMLSEALSRIPYVNFSIVALGGGSSIDLAKAILAQQVYGVWKGLGYGSARYYADQNMKKEVLFIAIPTSPASGSEVSRYFLIKDSRTRQKIVSRAWEICPDYALLDQSMLESMPLPQLILSAFDAFIHAWETYFCKYETSDFVRLIGADVMNRVLYSVAKLKSGLPVTNDIRASLQFAATEGGICLSNTRTGFLHTAGEALSSEIELSHPQTLKVFFEGCLIQYKENIEFDFKELCPRLPAGFDNLEKIINFWNGVWVSFGLENQLSEVLSGQIVNLQAIRTMVLKDQVLLTKEHPSRLSDHALNEIISSGLVRYGAKLVSESG